MKKVLILWSGGIDSTSILKQYLEKTNYIIYALNINYITLVSKQRVNEEQKSINKLLPELLKIRDFKFIKLDYSLESVVILSDMIHLGTLSLSIASQYNINEIILSVVSDARENQDFYINNTLNSLNIITNTMFEYHKNKNYWIVLPIFIIPKFYNTKEIYIKELGYLFELTWSCRVAKGSPCGKCEPCQHIKRSINI